MSNPVIEAFFFGRALAEVLKEKAEESWTNLASEISKFDAEQREKLREFIEEVQARAKVEAESGTHKVVNTTATNNGAGQDMQETIDQLRAEIARLRSEIKAYKNQNS
ncbi:MAG: hypothetical protein D6756_06070 [Cyanobacteria bacterium J083]|nr:MAG: hypothetical protein D6756_06070 [Cyanobacteria bacterium J083]